MTTSGKVRRRRPRPETGKVVLEKAIDRLMNGEAGRLPPYLSLTYAAQLLELIAESVHGGEAAEQIVELGDSDPVLVSYLGRLLLRAVIQECAAHPERMDSAEVLRLLDGFVRLQERIEPATIPLDPAMPAALPNFVAVAHDLRSPITSIAFLAQSLQHEHSGPLNEIQRRQLGIIGSAALSLSNLVSDLIDFGSSSVGPTERPVSEFSIRVLLESIRDLVHPLVLVKDLRLELVIPGLERRVGDPVALSRVLLNLTTNGLKFTDAGVVELAAREISETRVEFSVRDTGRGIDPDLLLNASPGFRPGNSSTGFDGLGLGLAICRKFLKELSSELQVESRPGEGTRFFFELDLPPVAS